MSGVRWRLGLRCVVALAAGWWAFAALAAGPATYGIEDFARVEKIDAHVHLHGDVSALLERARRDRFRLLTVNVNYDDFPPLPQQFDDALALTRAHPDLVAFVGTFDATASADRGWLSRAGEQIDAALRQGAVGIKVWKDIGMRRDADGRVVMIDDPRFTPIFRQLETRGVVVLGHQGEPRNAWLPVQEMTIRGDREYFAAHPQYHMHGRADWPSYEDQIAARDRLLDRHPDLRFVGVHLASLEWDVERIAAFLRRYPQASVDLAARLSHLQLQASANRERVRRFFIEFQDRVLYGTDLASQPGEDGIALAGQVHRVWLEDWRFLAGGEPMRSEAFDAPFRGLALPREVIDKIYHANARRLFPTAWQGSSHPEQGALRHDD